MLTNRDILSSFYNGQNFIREIHTFKKICFCQRNQNLNIYENFRHESKHLKIYLENKSYNLEIRYFRKILNYNSGTIKIRYPKFKLNLFFINSNAQCNFKILA